MRTRTAQLVSAAVLALASGSAAAIAFDQDVMPDVIFGSGNANGSFTVDTGGGVEVGLRAKLRFDAANQPQNVFNSNGDGTYSFAAGKPAGGGFGWAPGSDSTAIWNFEWTINSDLADVGGGGTRLDDFTYVIGIDFDPGVGTNYLAFDPINAPVVSAPNACADHALGDNSTGNGGGTANDCSDPANTYAADIAALNVAQNSWNMEFFDDAGGGFPFDANVDGLYDFYLAAFDASGQQVARTEMQVIVGEGATVPAPATALLLGVGLLGLRVRSTRRRG